MGHGWEGGGLGGLGGGGGGPGRGGRRGKLRRGDRETQTGDQELSVVISCSKYIDKLDGQTVRCIEELCVTLLLKLVIS